MSGSIAHGLTDLSATQLRSFIFHVWCLNARITWDELLAWREQQGLSNRWLPPSKYDNYGERIDGGDPACPRR